MTTHAIRRKRLMSKVRRLGQRCKTAQRFVEEASHDFRTPLTVIKEYASLLHCDALGPINAQQLQFLETIENRTDDLNRMLDDLLDSSRLDAGLLVMSRAECSLADIIGGLQPELTRKAEFRAVHLRVAVAEDLPAVYCDADKVGRVLGNLLGNALKSCGEGGQARITVGADSSAKNAVISVSDNGCQPDAKHLELIAGQLKQARYRAPQKHGMNMGLAIAKEFVGLNFGQLTVASEPQMGTKFTFTLPFADPLNVASRWLNRLTARTRGKFAASLLSATVVAGAEPDSDEEIHGVLNDLMRADDVLFRLEPGRWIVLLAGRASGVGEFCVRAKAMLEDVPRNRSKCAFPAIKFATEGSWRMPGEALDFLTCCAGRMPATVCS